MPWLKSIWSFLATFAQRFQTTRSDGSATDALPPESSPVSSTSQSYTLAWGARVSPEFRATALDVAESLGMNPNHLMACIAFETGETFSPSIRNAAGSGATGLIQFMPATAKGLGTTTDALAKISAVDQLSYVRMYFKPYAGRLHTLSDTYMAILWPRGIGKPEDFVLWDRATMSTTYRQNAGLDVNKDGVITKGEAARLVQSKLDRGMLPANVWVGK